MSLAFSPKSTALVLIDLQIGVLGMPLAPHSADQVIEKSASLIGRCHEVGATIVLVHVAFAKDGVDRLNLPVDAPWTPPPGGIPENYSAIVPQVASLHHDMVITKRQWGAFYGTDLDLQLRRRRIDTIILGGIATNFGVESTAREAWQHNYALVIAEDACSSVSKEHHDFAIEKILPRLGRIRSSAEIVKALSA